MTPRPAALLLALGLAAPLLTGAPAAHAAPAAPPAAVTAATTAATASTTSSTNPIALARAMETAVASHLAAGARSRYLGSSLSGMVVDRTSGRLIWSSNVSRTRMPASTQKVLTAFVALRSMDPSKQFVTRTWQSQENPDNIYLRGAGDPTMTSTRLASLAKRTAQALQAQGRTSVDLYLDDSIVPAPSSAVGWKASYLSGGEVQRIRGLTLAGYRGSDGTVAAGNIFRAQLLLNGITVTDFGRGVAPESRDQLAESWSAQVRSILATMLSASNNDYAEYLLRHSALEAGAYPTWTKSLAHARSVLVANGIPTAGYAAYDGSGLSRANRMPVRTLVSTVSKMYANPSDRALAFAWGAMPRAGQTGTLRSRYKSAAQRCATGKVIAKTGTRGDVVGLAGVAKGADGRDRVFAFLENGNTKTASVRNAVDTLATATVGCR